MSAPAGTATEAMRLGTAILEALGAAPEDGAWVTPGGARIEAADVARCATDLGLLKRLEKDAGLDDGGHECRFDGHGWYAVAIVGDGERIAGGACATEEEARARRLVKFLRHKAARGRTEERPPEELYPRLRVWAGGFASSGIWMIDAPGQDAAGVMVSHDRLQLPGELAQEFNAWCTYHEMFSRQDRARGEADWQAFKAKQRDIAHKLKRHFGQRVYVECRFGDETFAV